MKPLERLRRAVAAHHGCSWRQVRVRVRLWEGWMWLVDVQRPGGAWKRASGTFYGTARRGIVTEAAWYERGAPRNADGDAVMA